MEILTCNNSVFHDFFPDVPVIVFTDLIFMFCFYNCCIRRIKLMRGICALNYYTYFIIIIIVITRHEGAHNHIGCSLNIRSTVQRTWLAQTPARVKKAVVFFKRLQTKQLWTKQDILLTPDRVIHLIHKSWNSCSTACVKRSHPTLVQGCKWQKWFSPEK